MTLEYGLRMIKILLKNNDRPRQEILIIMKKTWEKPKLKSFGTIESVTKMQLDEAIKLGEFIIPDEGLGLFSSLRL